jgi:phosphatidylserine decarboxylase
VLGTFARMVGIDATEADLPLEEYASLNAFFVRRLRPGARTWPMDAATLASPVDGIVGRHGTIDGGRLVQAKGRDYSAAALLGDGEEAARFEHGTFVTVYLSPRHYHRIHSPCDGTIPSARYIPGALLPVNEPAVQHVADLFPRNERVTCTIDGPLGRTAVVAIGAYNVGRISAAFDPAWVGPMSSITNRGERMPAVRSYTPPLRVTQGDEIMAFHLGSTIVLLSEPGLRNVAPPPGTEVRLGDVLLRGS